MEEQKKELKWWYSLEKFLKVCVCVCVRGVCVWNEKARSQKMNTDR